MSDSGDQGEVIYKKGEDDSEQDEIWDDTELIKCYDKAVNLAYDAAHANLKSKGELNGLFLPPSNKPKMKIYEENLNESSDNLVGPEKTSKKSKKNRKSKRRRNREKKEKWNVGDVCMAQFFEDGLFYEGVIVALDQSTGKCVVRFTGYENEEEHLINNLHNPSEWKLENNIEGDDTGEESNSTMDVSSSNEVRDDGNVNNRSCIPKFLHSKHQANWANDLHGIDGSTAVPFLSPPVPPNFLHVDEIPSEEEAMSSMLMSWYMNGYHTGYYQAMKDMKKNRLHKKH